MRVQWTNVCSCGGRHLRWYSCLLERIMELRYIRRRNGENFMQMHINAAKVSQEPCLQYSAHGGKGKCSRLGVIEFPKRWHTIATPGLLHWRQHLLWGSTSRQGSCLPQLQMPDIYLPPPNEQLRKNWGSTSRQGSCLPQLQMPDIYLPPPNEQLRKKLSIIQCDTKFMRYTRRRQSNRVKR